jgi:predicted PP-loop superfamily ATPase
MPDRVKDFEQKRALESIATDDRVEDRREEFIGRYLELLEEPEERNPLILQNQILELYELDGEEDGDWESAELYWEKVGELATLGFSELHEIPIADRGGSFSDARSLMSRWAYDQAFIEIFAFDEIVTSARSAEDIKKASKDFTLDELRNLSDGQIDIKAAKDRIKAEKNNASES